MTKRRVKYFDRFRSQREMYETDLPAEFFYEWHDKITDWMVSSASCRFHLISHKDCPNDLREQYTKASRYEQRSAAYTSNQEFMYRNLDKIFADKASTVHAAALFKMFHTLSLGQTIPHSAFIQILEYAKRENIPSFNARHVLQLVLNSFKQSIKDKQSALLHPDPSVRALAKMYYTASPEQQAEIQSYC